MCKSTSDWLFNIPAVKNKMAAVINTLEMKELLTDVRSKPEKSQQVNGESGVIRE